MAKREEVRLQVFLMGDGVTVAMSGRKTPDGYYKLDRMLSVVPRHGGCFIETGSSRAAYGTGNFYADHAPAVTLHHPARRWHWSKVVFEQQVMRRWP